MCVLVGGGGGGEGGVRQFFFSPLPMMEPVNRLLLTILYFYKWHVLINHGDFLPYLSS